jgi:hypothetical protein
MGADIRAIHDGIDRLRTRWPQSHYCPGSYGQYLILIPGVMLPEGYRENICTVLFIVPPGFPAARPDHFFTDIEIRLENGALPKGTLMEGCNNTPLHDWPQWEGHCQWWSWHLQMWDPNYSGLVTFFSAIRQRLNPAR